MVYKLCILFISSFLITYILSPISLKVGNQLGLIDKPEKRKINKRSLVRIGGVCLLISSLISYFIIIFLNQDLNVSYPEVKNFFLICSYISISAFTLGFADDAKSLPPLFRLFVQILISISIWLSGIQILNIDISFINIDIQTLNLNKYISLLITVLWICGITNAINWIDGLDGLASSIVGIGSLSFALITLNMGNDIVSLILIGLSGSCLGFFILNSHPAKLIMGDGGSYFLGFNLGYLSIIGSTSYSTLNNMDLPIQKLHIFILIFAIPIFDMAFVIGSRLFKKVSPFYPDNNHIHHRLIKAGLSHKKVVDICIISSILISIFSLFSFIKL